MKAVEIRKDIYWVGAIDWSMRSFHGYETSRGSSYNAYLILDDKVTLIEPNAGTLRGVSLAAVAQSEVDALIKVLPRMTYPALTTQELTAMNLPDMLSLAAKVIGFLSPASAE